MKKNRLLYRLVVIELVLIYLVVLAGSVVRSTGSGMGCPDWPKCFGYYIPPTQESQVDFIAENAYKKGQFIIHEKKMMRAKSNFISSDTFDPNQWEVYTKHDYNIFNPVHTWIEYINRLLGALAGLPMLLIAFFSLAYLKRMKMIPMLGFSGLVMLGLVAWLGKLVVDGNLIPGQITLHMIGAMSIIAILVGLFALLEKSREELLTLDRGTGKLLGLSLVLLLMQIIMGTQVREEIDIISKQLLGEQRYTWIEMLSTKFYIHRSSSIALLLLNFYLMYRNKISENKLRGIPALFGLTAASAVVGIVLTYAGVPATFQPPHLVLAMLMFGLNFYLWLIHQLSRTQDSVEDSVKQDLRMATPAIFSTMDKKN